MDIDFNVYPIGSVNFDVFRLIMNNRTIHHARTMMYLD